MSRTYACLVSLVLLLAPLTAGAQPRPSAIPSSNGDGLDTHLSRPALDSRGLISVNGVDVLPAGRISVGLTMDYGRGLLRVADAGQKSTALVRDSFTGTFAFDYGIADRAVVGISAPALLMSGDPQPGPPGWGPQALDAQSIGHVALHGKLKLTRAGSGLGVAVAAQVGVPVSDAPRNAGADPSLWYCARGYGFYCPRAEGHDEEAWGRNRRVEFVILKTTQGRTGAPMGCDAATAHGVAPAPVP